MVKHIIVWKFKEDLVDKETRAKEIKVALEGLVGKIEGLVKMNIIINGLGSSSGSLMMDSLFTCEQALKDYQKHPLHQQVANGLVRPSVELRLSYDYEE